MPEIDVPAHGRSIVRVRPALGLNNGDSDTLDLSKPETTEFVKGIFDEFTPWFRGSYVHFGADEYEKEHAELYLRFFNEISASDQRIVELATGIGPRPANLGHQAV